MGADPAFFYSTYGYGHPQAVSYNAFNGYVQPQSGPWTGYNAPIAAYSHDSMRHSVMAPMASPVQKTVGAHQPYGYAASGHYMANSVGAVHYAKREAEAEAEAEAEPQTWNFNGVYNFPTQFSYPSVYNQNFPKVYNQNFPKVYNQNFPRVYNQMVPSYSGAVYGGYPASYYY